MWTDVGPEQLLVGVFRMVRLQDHMRLADWLLLWTCYPFLQGHVVMGNNAISPYQQVIEKTKSLSFRSQMLTMNIEKKQAQSTKSEVSNTCTVRTKYAQTAPPSASLKAAV